MIFVLVLIFFGSLNDFCDGCAVGFYGESCSKECPKICYGNKCNVTTGKCLYCVNGYYSDINKECIPCPAHCTICSSEKYCAACTIGFKGEVCDDMCTNCKPYTSCDKQTGYCSEICREGLSGELCDILCNSKCQSCDRRNRDECILCAAGYRVELTCNQTDRVCNIGCKALTKMQPDRQGSSTTDIGLIVGLVIGFIIVGICVCMLVFIIVRRRSTNRRSFWSGDRNRTPATNDEENVGLVEAQTGTREFPSVEKITILQELGTFSAIEKKYDDMKITVAENKVTVEGYQLDIENAFKEINNKCGDIEQVCYIHSKSREWLRFYQKKQTIEYVKQKLKQKYLLGIWDITGTELNVSVNGKGNSENFKTTLLESVLEISEPVDNSLLSSEWWGEFVLDIRRKYQEKVDMFTNEQHDMVMICTDDVLKQVRIMVSEFLDGIIDATVLDPGVFEFVSNYWTQDDFDDIRKSGVMINTEANTIMLRGLQENVAMGKEKLNIKLKDLCSKQHVLKRNGIMTVLEAAKQSGTISDIETECRCIIKLPKEIDENPSVMLCDYGVMDSKLLEEIHQESCTNTSTICFQTRRHMIKIQLIQGDIVKQKADIIVAGAASNLDIQSGSAFNFSLEQGGPKLKTDHNKRYPNGIQNGEVAVIDSGNFKCDKIYLTSLPPWKEASRNGGKVLRNFMRECLRLADKFDKNSIAFIITMTWKELGYPTDMVVSMMYGAVAEFDSSYSKTSLKEINIVEDDETIKTYIMCYLKKQTRETRTERIFIEDGTILTKLYDDTKYRMVKDGCAIGPIQLHVQVGDLLNCTTDAIVIEVGANSDSKENVLQNNGVVITDSTELKAKHVIHALSEDTLAGWRSKLVRCLEEAGNKDLKSVALPVVGSGTGTKTFSPDGVGACLFAVIDDFTSQNPKTSVTDVRLVVDDSNAQCVPAIIAALQDRTTAVNSQWRIGKIFKSQLGLLESNRFKESSVTVHSDSTSNLDRCIKALDDRIGLEFAKKVIDVDRDVISSLNDKKENNRKSAMELYDQTKWFWLCGDKMTSMKEVPYDMMTNFYIETAYMAGTQTVELQSKDGKIYVIDFQNLIEYPKINVYDTVMVIRRDILNPGIFKDVENRISKKWTTTRVVQEDGEEYQQVQKLFFGEQKNGLDSYKDNSRSIKVVKIERIHNKTLVQQYYQAKEKVMKQEYGRMLWHETSEDYLQWIITNGFNRSYCRCHGVLYGQGVYFAADASYSAQSYLAGNKPGTNRYIFLAKVLTGKLIKGIPSMRVLPLVDPAEPTVMYDSAVDDVNNPTQFVIFHDKQAYPKYLITYTPY